jgi:hypothetical protein
LTPRIQYQQKKLIRLTRFKGESIMRRFMTLLGVALVGYALLPTVAQAQVIYVQPRPYTVFAPQVVPVYYGAPSITTYSSPATYSYYQPATTVYSYAAPVPTYSYSAPAPYYTYSAPAAGVYTTRTSYGYGIFRPRGYYNESYYTPLR